MKKTSFIAFILALCFLAPSIMLLACQDEDLLSTPSYTESVESPSDVETESSESDSTTPPTSEPQESVPPDSQQPEAPPSNSPPENSSPKEETPPPVMQTAKYIKCTGENVNIRSGAGTSYRVLGQAEEGTMYAVISKTGNWYKTYYKNKTAYLYASYASVFTLKKTKNEVESVIEEGYKLLGIPYVYGAVRLHDGKGNLLGGFTAQKFDCSSLIQYIFYKGANELLGVHTRAQVLQGKHVKKSDLQRGDCIFFTNEQRQYNKGIERVGHVALYLGDGYILHTASDYARIEKISNKRWSFYIEARRFL